MAADVQTVATYMRAFFLGPGLPRGLGAPASNCDAVRFREGFPAPPFRLDPLIGGARRLFAVAAGVETAMESGAVGAGEGTFVSVEVEAEARGVGSAMESDGNLDKRVCDKDSLMIFDFGSLVEDFGVMVARAGVVIEADMAIVVVSCGVVRERGSVR